MAKRNNNRRNNNNLGGFLQGLKQNNKPIIDLLAQIASNTSGKGGSGGLVKGVLETALGIKLGDYKGKSSIGGNSSTTQTFNINIVNNNAGASTSTLSAPSASVMNPVHNPGVIPGMTAPTAEMPKGDDLMEALGFPKPVVTPKSKTKRSHKSFWDEAFPEHEWAEDVEPLKLAKEMETINVDLPVSMAARESAQPLKDKPFMTRPKNYTGKKVYGEPVGLSRRGEPDIEWNTSGLNEGELGKGAWKKMKDMEEPNPYQKHSVEGQPGAKADFIGKLASAKMPAAVAGEGAAAAEGAGAAALGAGASIPLIGQIVAATVAAAVAVVKLEQAILQPGDGYVGNNQASYNKMLQDSASNQTDWRVMGGNLIAEGPGNIGLLISGIMKGVVG